MAIKAEPRRELQGSPAVLLLGVAAVGAGLYFLMAGQKKEIVQVKAHYEFDYTGPAQVLATGVRFGHPLLNIFNYRSDWLFCKKPLSLPDSPNGRHITGDMIVNIPALPPPDPTWPVPHTYDAEFTIRTDCPGDVAG